MKKTHGVEQIITKVRDFRFGQLLRKVGKHVIKLRKWFYFLVLRDALESERKECGSSETSVIENVPCQIPADFVISPTLKNSTEKTVDEASNLALHSKLFMIQLFYL